MAERIFGVETEYGFSIMGGRGRGCPPSKAVDALLLLARINLPHLPAAAGGIFLQNGGRLYKDCGVHPELTTPECTNPWDIARYVRAGEWMLTMLAGKLGNRLDDGSEVLLLRSNVEYSGARNTWGCHESYLHRSDPSQLPKHIIPHLVSRIIYTGAGGFDPMSPGISFLISPRVAHIQLDVAPESTGGRGIFHTKDEPLASEGHHRLHLICGESNCSELAIFLKVGVTSLIVAMIEAGIRPGNAVQLPKPLEAMRAFASDPFCKASAPSIRGDELTAIQIQRHYLALAEAHAHDSFMPPWSEEVCRQWRAILDRLERGSPNSVATQLDWAIKHELIRHQIQQRGLDEETIRFWNKELNSLIEPLHKFDDEDLLLAFDLEMILDKRAPYANAVRGMERSMGEKSLCWDDLKPFLALRQELFEIDTRFGQLGGYRPGIFNELEQAGVLNQHFPGVDNIEHAIANPPAIGRARLRGECVRRFSGNNGNYACDWSRVWDGHANRVLDLGNPFASEERWVDYPAEPLLRAARSARNAHGSNWEQILDGLIGDHRISSDTPDSSLDRVLRLYDAGHYELAGQLLTRMENGLPSEQFSRRHLRYKALIQSCRGFVDGVETLHVMARGRALTLDDVCDYTMAYRYQGLVPPVQIEEWIARGLEMISQSPDESGQAFGAFLGHVAHNHLRNGRATEAQRALERVYDPVVAIQVHPHVMARIHADLGEAFRLHGNFASGLLWLRKWDPLESTCRHASLSIL